MRFAVAPVDGSSPLTYFVSLWNRAPLTLQVLRLRLPVPVISVGNLTWGGNGKTPMVEFLARLFADSGIPPLILTRGYAGGDEAIMPRRHLEGTSAKIGMCINRSKAEQREMSVLVSGGIGVAILDDGIQHLSLWRDLDIVMVNATMPWGNSCLIPLGPLREPLPALKRADIVVIHHADLVTEQDMEKLESLMYKIKDDLPIFSTAMVPSHYFKVGNSSCNLPLKVVINATVLCVSGIVGLQLPLSEQLRRWDLDLLSAWTSVIIMSFKNRI
ncbi:unnamed protein product [Rhodiola kirilowii]